MTISSDFHRTHNIPDEIARPTGSPWIVNGDSGKNRGGGLCIYVHDGWCNNSTVLDRHCSPDLEFMSSTNKAHKEDHHHLA
ncbi:unnamed protein product [Menidia menidia]|uniref:(Atlantic silverside) hypothetical protein n=1 Tax=Menidia menidia TaxID=238744 RepID=A0A8S4AMR0_9TELE|nr:unnamed protein product [Menidia menidia]